MCCSACSTWATDGSEVVPTVTVLDDYQNVALTVADWSPVRERFDVDVVDEHIDDEGELVARLADSEVVVVMRERTPFPASVLNALPNLRLLITTGMANAALDLDAARARGVTVCGTTAAGNAMPELTIGMIIALTRNFAAEDAAVRAGRWQHTIGPGLAGSTLGVVGLGRLGAPVVRLAQAFDMSVIAWSPNLTPERAAEHGARAVAKQELFAQADVVTIHMPLSERSRGLVGADELGAMQPTAYLINTSRGPIVEESALLDALRERRIAGAGLDVYDVEPLPVDHPLRSVPNTLLLPHIGYVTTDTYRHWFAQVVEDIVAWDDGNPQRTLT
ncbi:D-2-hydroxyacid dehydrogenase family protein [uncultured Jatrophihabitans sp.]|uniref:D-2-hydroxyacid dehydrogenase family protein n=1 Tax=uncultured Jatrophihabitans sp. TaxID=1610747 RepID=UPI0035CBC334